MGFVNEYTINIEGAGGEGVCVGSGDQLIWIQGVDYLCTWKIDGYHANTTKGRL